MRNTGDYKTDIGYTTMETDQRYPKSNKTLRPDIVFFPEPATKAIDTIEKEIEKFLGDN